MEKGGRSRVGILLIIEERKGVRNGVGRVGGERGLWGRRLSRGERYWVNGGLGRG